MTSHTAKPSDEPSSSKINNKLPEKKLHHKKFRTTFKAWLKRLVSFRTHHSLEETVSEIIEEYNPKREKMTSEEQKILHNFLEFGSKKVSNIIIPRSDICAVKDTATINDIISSFTHFAHTRIIVYKEDLDDIVGFIHIKDLIPILAGKEKFNLNKLIRKTILVAPSMKLHDLLSQMQKQRTHIAIVLDEYGGTHGIVTMEDIIEVIFGEIDDEHDVKNQIEDYKMLNEHTLIASARMEIKVLEQILKIKLKTEEDDFETVGGLILARHGHMPKKGSIVPITHNINAEIIDANPRSLKQVKISVAELDHQEAH
jgi:magnesium and cobalt transporter